MAQAEPSPAKSRAVVSPIERAVDMPKPTKTAQAAKIEGTAEPDKPPKERTPAPMAQPSPTPLKIKAQPTVTPVEAHGSKTQNGREKLKAESAVPPSASQQTATVEKMPPVAPASQPKASQTPPRRAKLTPTQAPLPVEQERPSSKGERKETRGEKSAPALSEPPKAAPTEAQPIKGTVPKAATPDKSAVVENGRQAQAVKEQIAPAKIARQPKEAPAAQTLELFPVDATEAPKNMPSKLKIAVSVNRPTNKK